MDHLSSFVSKEVLLLVVILGSYLLVMEQLIFFRDHSCCVKESLSLCS